MAVVGVASTLMLTTSGSANTAQAAYCIPYGCALLENCVPYAPMYPDTRFYNNPCVAAAQDALNSVLWWRVSHGSPVARGWVGIAVDGDYGDRTGTAAAGFSRTFSLPPDTVLDGRDMVHLNNACKYTPSVACH